MGSGSGPVANDPPKGEEPSKAPTDLDREIGARIRQRRQALGFTQEALADAIGLTFQQVQKYEKGANRISVGRLQQIAAALQTDLASLIDGFLFGDEACLDSSPLRTPAATGHARELLEAWCALPPPLRARCLALIQAIAERSAERRLSASVGKSLL